MSRRYLASVACLSLLASVHSVHAQEKGAPALPPGTARAMALGPEQAQLSTLVGTWDVDIALSSGAGAAQHSRGTAEYTWVVKGRWLGCHLSGQMLGLPYEQFTILGYDSYARNTVEVAVESVDNSMLMSRGSAPQPHQPVTVLFGELDEYTTGVLHRPYKVVIDRVSTDRHVVTIEGFDDRGQAVKKLQLTFSRRAAAPHE